MSLKWYVARRILWAVFVTWVALSVTWALFYVSPVGGELRAAQEAAQTGGDPEEAIEDYKKRIGEDSPWYEQYYKYVINMFLFNWGWSTSYQKPVLDVFIEAWGYSFQYGAPSVILTALIGFGLGLYSAVNRYTPSDYLATFIAYFGLSIPNFWFAIMLILIAGIWFQDAEILGLSLAPLKVPTFYDSQVISAANGGMFGYNIIAPSTGFKYGFISTENARQLILPVIVISTAGFASQMRYSRAQALEYVNTDFVKVAYAKGASQTRVVVKHIFRVALVPLSTILVGDVLAILLTSSIIIEQIFQIPGLGLITYRAITTNPDTAVVMAGALVPIFIAVIGYLLQDLAYVALDPRIDYEDR